MERLIINVEVKVEVKVGTSLITSFIAHIETECQINLATRLNYEWRRHTSVAWLKLVEIHQTARSKLRTIQ